MLRIALIVLLSLVAAEAGASFPATSGCTSNAWTTNYGSGNESTFAAAKAAACSSFLAANPTWFGCETTTDPSVQWTFPWTGGASGPSCPGNSYGYASNGSTTQYVNIAINSSSPGYSCPANATLSGTTCTCNAGYSESGSSCVLDTCPAAGVSIGTRNVTIGWALGPVPGTDDVVSNSVNLQALSSDVHCVDSAGSFCKGVGTGLSNVQDVWRSSQPSANGLYRISADIEIVSNGGGSCTVATDEPASPSASPADCPTGNVGTVNGKPVCLGTMPATGVNFGDNETPGNPRAGTSPSQSNSSREPTAGAGGGPDARGGPGVTNGAGGNVGTGNDRTVGTGGTGQPGPIEVEVETCGLPGTPPCKIDETGTPTTSNATTTATENVQGSADSLGTKLEGIVSGSDKPSNIGWGVSSISFPTTCTPFSIGTARWGFFTIDLCQYQGVIHDLMALVWVSFTIFFAIGMVFRAVTGG